MNAQMMIAVRNEAVYHYLYGTLIKYYINNINTIIMAKIKLKNELDYRF